MVTYWLVSSKSPPELVVESGDFTRGRTAAELVAFVGTVALVGARALPGSSS